MAKVGTDTASIIAISPEMLGFILQEGELLEILEKEGFGGKMMEETKRIIREHGGAFISTGADGWWDVKAYPMPFREPKEFGATEPYGTKKYLKDLQEKVKAKKKSKGKDEKQTS